MNSSTRVFVAGDDFISIGKEQGVDVGTVKVPNPSNRVREIQVTGTAEVSSPADKVCVRMSVSNSKESVNEVTNSVTRRLDYILQSLRQFGIKDEETSVRRFLHREAHLYQMGAEVLVTFSDFKKMEQLRSILLEKMDTSVCVGAPEFYHSTGCLSELRRRACVSAVENAQQKASEVSQLLGQSLGPPLLVREEETREWRNEDEGSRGNNVVNFHHLPCTPTINVSSRVSVSFSLRDRNRRKV